MIKFKQFFRFDNKYFGALLAFFISFIAFLLTLEPGPSFWDCGEFLSCAYNLGVSHPPGSPLHALLGRVFSFFSFGNPSYIAYSINFLSAISSGFAIYFMFLSIWYLISITLNGNITPYKLFFLSFSCSLIFAFTDTFWFSAVESEVYALSSFFTAITIWCVLQWHYNRENNSSLKWLILASFITGLSFGVHLLNILIIPGAISLIYFSYHKFSISSVLKVALISLLAIFIVYQFIFYGIPIAGSWFDLIFVNSLGFYENTGLIFFILIVIILLFILHKQLNNHSLHILSTVSVSIIYIILGFSIYALVLVRSNSNPSIDMSNVENPYALIDYLNREQYGSRPLIKGPSFASPVIDLKERSTYEFFNGKYIKKPLNSEEVYNENCLGYFPRMHSTDENHIEAYKKWSNFSGRTVQIENQKIVEPTFGDNIKFFINYQLGYMYFRYLMWNFCGRQNDNQGVGNAKDGNWITGIGFVDNFRLETSLNSENNSQSNNKLYAIPIILIVIGMFYQWKKSKEIFFTLFLFFLFTGPAIVVYLNEIPITPRERDYAFVGSFYFLAFWIPFGILKLLEYFKYTNIIKYTFTTVCILLPIFILYTNYDDHDRSGRYTVRDYAKEFLNSCDKNAIIFTTADNDTYPLWYAQQVENIRPDITIVLTPYLSANWYVNSLKSNKNNPLLMSCSPDKIAGGKRLYIPVVNRINDTIDFKSILNFFYSDSNQTTLSLSNGNDYNYIPAQSIKFMSDLNPTLLKLSNSLRPDHLIMLDIIENNYKSRPIYFTSGSDIESLVKDNVITCEGLVWKLNTSNVEGQKYNSAKMSELAFRLEKWKSIQNKSVYHDFNHRHILRFLSLRSKFSEFSLQLYHDGKKAEAEKYLNFCDNFFKYLPDDFNYETFIELQVANEIKSNDVLHSKLNEFSKYILLKKEIYDGKSTREKDSNRDYLISKYFLKEIVSIIQNNNLTKEYTYIVGLMNVY